MNRTAAAPDTAKSPVVAPLLQRALSFLEMGDEHGAQLLLDTHFARNPDDAAAHNLQGVLHRRGGRAPEALASFERAAAFDPAEPLYAVNVAGALGAVGRSEEALRVLDGFLTRVPGQADALIQRTLLLGRMGRHPEATAMARMAVAFHRDLARA